MDDLLSEFLAEASESLEVVDAELVRFEANPDDKATLNNIFRLVHTLKGTCGFLGLPRLEAVAHAGETLLGRFRDGLLPVTPAAVTLVLRSIDRIKAIVGTLAETGQEPEQPDTELVAALEAMAEGHPAEPEPAPEPDPVPEPIAAAPEPPRELRPGEVSLEDLEAAFLAAPGPDEPLDLAPVSLDLAARSEEHTSELQSH